MRLFPLIVLSSKAGDCENRKAVIIQSARQAQPTGAKKARSPKTGFWPFLRLEDSCWEKVGLEVIADFSP